jgi:hypothetical protein
MKTGAKLDEHITAEGLLVAIEYLVTDAMRKSKTDMSVVGLEVSSGKLTRTGSLAALIFTMVHPWITQHVPNETVCNTSDADHRVEYKHMLGLAKATLSAREYALAADDDESEDDD